MAKTYRITASILLILLVFSNFVAFSDTSANIKLEAKNLTDFESILKNQLEQKNDKITIKYYGKMSSIESMINTILDKDAYLRSTLREVACKYEEYSGKQTYTIVYYTVKYVNTKEEELLASKKIDKILEEIITDDMFTHEKVKAVNDYIVLNGQYDTEMKNYSHYELLFEGKSVCNGYALLAYNMLKKLNIPVLLVPGVANNGEGSIGHVWNLVNIGGYWFNLDTTWNDPIPDRKGIVSYDYFLKTDEIISKSHKADNNLTFPKSTITYDTYLNDFNKTKDTLITSPTTDGINIKIRDGYVDYKKYDKEPVEPFIESNRTLVPLRAVFAELGYNVNWDDNTNTATVTSGNKILKIKPNDSFATINGVKKSIDVPAKVVNDRIMVPVRFISEAFGNIVFWDIKNQTVIIY